MGRHYSPVVRTGMVCLALHSRSPGRTEAPPVRALLLGYGQDGQKEGSLLSKVAALYELRRFPEYSDVIVRMTEAPEIIGGGRAKAVLEQEFKLTHEAMRTHG